MALFTQSSDLQELIDWDAIMPMDRYAGGHDEQMRGLFKGATVIGHWNEGDYQGSVATCVQLEDGRIAVYQDSYGSCSGCDSWEDAQDKDVRKLCEGLAADARTFETLDDAVRWLDGFATGVYPESYSYWYAKCAAGLLESINHRATWSDEEKSLRTAAADDSDARGVYADWLEERGRNDEAAYLRERAKD